MDRFKFRVWNIENKNFIYDAIYAYDGNNYSSKDNDGWICCFGEYIDRNNEYIVEQCTGLKDKNGKFIYEGDILKSRYSDVMRYEVVYRNAGLCLRVFAIDKPETMDYLHIGKDVESIGLYEVIGNIHENKDL